MKQRDFHSVGHLPAIGSFLLMAASLGLFAACPHPAYAGDDAVALVQQDEAGAQFAEDDEARAQRLVDRLQNLVLSQQREIARQLVRQYPDTDAAKRAQELLEELELYDAADAAKREREDRRTEQIRNLWDARRPPAPTLPDLDITITNLGELGAIFQVRGPSMEWSRPVVLAVGETNRLKYPAAFRRITKEGTVLYSLQLGGRYVFLQNEGEATPRLYRMD